MDARKSFGKLGNRGLARLSVGLEARLQLTERSAQGVIENISRVGCCVKLAEPPRNGATALVRIEEIEALGTVVWVTGERCGLTFSSQLSAEAVERFRWIVEHFSEHQNASISKASEAWR